MKPQRYHIISGIQDGVRLESRVLEERIQQAVAEGERRLEIQAFGQHGIGGRLWKAGDEPVHIRITGQAGQRAGSLGFPNTIIEIEGPSSDDVGWLNAGAEIIVHGNAANGVGNGMAQGCIRVAGNIGSRGMTMTKHNPRFAPPELWVLGSVGDYFGEFMAGGIAVICGFKAQNPDNVLGYRPLVGMVGGKVFFRGPHPGYSGADARPATIGSDDWTWLKDNLARFLDRIHRPELLAEISDPTAWRMLASRSSSEQGVQRPRSITAFRKETWERELGKGGLIGDLILLDPEPIPVIATGELRRFVPVWENRVHRPPCQAACPTGIPIHERWRLVREGRFDEAVDLALAYTPFPATVCGYLCPNPCMQACTRRSEQMPSVDITRLGKASVDARTPELKPLSGKKIAVIGGGPAGLSVAWKLRLEGHEAVVHDMTPQLGGKIVGLIPESRIPRDVVDAELERLRGVLPHARLRGTLGKKEVARLRKQYDFVVIAAGARKPRTLPVPGKVRAIPANDFLAGARTGNIDPGKRVVIIGAGNVGCDVATEAHRLGATDITLIDVQKPAAFGREKTEAEAAGAVFRWPCFTRAITPEGVELTTGEVLPADTVVMSIGDAPDLDFLPEDIETRGGYVVVDEFGRTSDPRVFAIGDVVKPGLLTDAIGAGRKAALAIVELVEGRTPVTECPDTIDRGRISLAYFDPRIVQIEDMDQQGAQCASCGACRDCGVCVNLCPQSAISRTETPDGGFQYGVDGERCIGCGFCAGGCPCGVWNMVDNTPLA